MRKEIVLEHKKFFIRVIEGADFYRDQEIIPVEQWMEALLEILKELKREQRQIFLIGNGASCSMAAHFAADFTKNIGITAHAADSGALLTCFSNDFTYQTAYAEILKRQMKNGDMLIAISSSGSSPNIINAARFVLDFYPKSVVVGFTGFSPNNPLKDTIHYGAYLNAKDYGTVESGHAYYLHMILDLFKMEEGLVG